MLFNAQSFSPLIGHLSALRTFLVTVELKSEKVELYNINYVLFSIKIRL